ncbi:MAG: hypothetical protein FWJ87_14725, partial [Micromonosporaceae bacterium]
MASATEVASRSRRRGSASRGGRRDRPVPREVVVGRDRGRAVGAGPGGRDPARADVVPRERLAVDSPARPAAAVARAARAARTAAVVRPAADRRPAAERRGGGS